MPQFRYRAARSDGTILQDRTEGVSEMAVRTQLETQGLFILHLEGARGWGTASISIKRSGSLPLREFLVFNQQFLALVKAGLPILKIFDILTERATHGDFQQAHNHVREEIRGGASISAAMACQPKYFSDLYRATIQSGEQTGNLVEVLQRYIAYLKLVIEVREKVTKALAYPLFLVLVGFGVVGFLLAYVIPTFAEVYEQSNAELPLPTQLLLAAIAQAGIWVPWVIGKNPQRSNGFPPYFASLAPNRGYHIEKPNHSAVADSRHDSRRRNSSSVSAEHHRQCHDQSSVCTGINPGRLTCEGGDGPGRLIKGGSLSPAYDHRNDRGGGTNRVAGNHAPGGRRIS